jgi:hypothetical protein
MCSTLSIKWRSVYVVLKILKNKLISKFPAWSLPHGRVLTVLMYSRWVKSKEVP